MSFSSKVLAVSVALLSSSAVVAQTAITVPPLAPQACDKIKEALKNAQDNAQSCAVAAADYIERNQLTMLQDARCASATCPADAAAKLGVALAEKFPDQAEDLIAQVVAGNLPLVGEIIIAMTDTLPDEKKATFFDRLIAAIDKLIPGFSKQEGFADIFTGLNLPGVPGALSVGAERRDAASPT